MSKEASQGIDNQMETDTTKVMYCKKCLMPTSRPRIVFDEDGICNACHNAENKFENIDWAKRKEQFLEILNTYKVKDGSWDCIVPWSGGKDSSAIAYKLKFEFGMNPLLVSVSPQVPSEVGYHNREELIQKGFDNLFFRPNQKVHRRLAKRFFTERGDQKIPWQTCVNTIPLQVAVNYKIPLVFFAEHGEAEYGGKVLNEESYMFRNFTEVLEHQIGDDPRNWIDDEITENDLAPYIYPDIEEVRKLKVRAYYFSYFFKWSMYENYIYLKDKFDFRVCAEGRTEGTFTNFDSLDDKSDNLFYYLQYIKFGFGRALRDASRMVQNKQMTREEGVELAYKYDHEFPKRYFQDMLEYLNITENEFHEIVDKHRNPEIWKKENGEWVLRYPLQ